MQTHLEPLAETAEAAPGRRVERDASRRCGIVREETGAAPRELRFLETEDGLVVFLTLGARSDERSLDAHAQASEVEEHIRREQPESPTSSSTPSHETQKISA